MNTTVAIDLNKIALRYLVIATVGSAIIVVGTYFLHYYKVDIRLDKDSVLTSLGSSKATVTDIIQNYVVPEGIHSTTPEPAQSGAPQAQNPGGQTPSPVATPVAPPSTASNWAVVRSVNTKAYNRSGKFLRTIPAGTLVDILNIKNTSAGELAVCKILYEGREVPDIVIKTEDMDIQRGALAEANPREKDLRVQYVQLLQNISDRERQLTEAAKGKNPHYASYKVALTAYTNMRNKTQELIKKRDTAQGSDRMEVYDQLRIMKGESVAVKQNYEQAKKKYEEWNATNAQQAIPQDDAQLASLRGQLRGLEEELRAFPRR